MLELALRLVFSLAVVVGLMLLLARFAARRHQGRNGDLVRVLQRQPLTRGTSVSVVAVGSRVYALAGGPSPGLTVSGANQYLDLAGSTG